jgi:hypothetical protein
MVAVPSAIAVTVADRPLPDTDATPLLLLDQETFLFVALLGSMVAVRLSVASTVRLDEFLLRVTPVTDTGVVETVTAHVAVLLPSWVVTVMVAVPSATPVTVADRPLPDIDATELLLLDQETFLFVALLGAMETVRLSVPPMVMLVEVLFRDTPVTAIDVGGVSWSLGKKPLPLPHATLARERNKAARMAEQYDAAFADSLDILLVGFILLPPMSG